MKTLIASMATTVALSAAVVHACDDHHGKCQVEDWRWYSLMPGTIIIEGVATCHSGALSLRLYEGHGDAAKFLATATTYVRGHTFETVVYEVDPKDPSIRYSIDPDG